MSDITQDELKSVLHYAPETGVFTHLRTISSGIKPGNVAGSTHHRGYVYIQINKRRYPAHRLAWLYVNGCFPDKQIDHINGNRDDNRIANLRLASNSQNQQNTATRHDNRTGRRGVVWMSGAGRQKRWRAEIKANGKYSCIGYFQTFEEAVAAREAAEAELHPFRTARAALEERT